jgi:type VI secretion system secreted protein VgrG
MGWSRNCRRATWRQRRPDLETLETRNLLTVGPGHGHFGAKHGHAAVTHLNTRPSPTATSLNSGTASTSDPIGSALARSTYGVSGTGMTVAVIDTGVNYDNPALGNGFGPGNKVVAGSDFADNSADPMATGSQHGTAVAGLIASSDPNHPGVAPGADIAALKVFSDNAPGSFDYVAQALQWVIDNHARYNITAVNLSMADGHNYTQNWFTQDGGTGQTLTGLIGQLDALNIPVIASTGNSFTGQQGEGFPAIIADTISVTSTTADGSQLSSDAQRLGATMGGDSATDIAAPGEGLVAPVQGNAFATVDGTSFAAAEVSGAVVLLQQIYQSRFGSLPTVAQLDNWLQEGADPVSDPATHISIGGLDIPRAASFIPNPNPQPQILIAPHSIAGTATATATATTPVNPPATAITPTTDTTTAATGTSDHPTTNPTDGGGSARTPDPAPPVAPPPVVPQQSSPSSDSSTATTNPAPPASPSSPGVPTPPPVTQKTLAQRLWNLFSLASPWKFLGGSGTNRGGVWTNALNPQNAMGSSQPAGQIRSLVAPAAHPRFPTGPQLKPGHSWFVRGAHHR